jgi:DNA-binding PadR family transcriptional regulator
MRLSRSSTKILRAFLDEPLQVQYGFGLMKVTGVKAGSLYPILERLEEEGWIKGQEEVIDEGAEGRPARRLYRLTALGETEGADALVDFYRDVGPAPAWLPRLGEG